MIKYKYEIRYIGGCTGIDKAKTKVEALEFIKGRLNIQPYLKGEIFKNGVFIESYEYVFNHETGRSKFTRVE